MPPWPARAPCGPRPAAPRLGSPRTFLLGHGDSVAPPPGRGQFRRPRLTRLLTALVEGWRGLALAGPVQWRGTARLHATGLRDAALAGGGREMDAGTAWQPIEYDGAWRR